MTPPLHISALARIAAPDYRVFRAFDHLLLVHRGGVLLVPVGLVDGDLTGVVDRCPVPWIEVWHALDTPQGEVEALSPEQLARVAPLLAQHLEPFGWVRETLPAVPGVPRMLRLTGPNGLRWMDAGWE